MDQFSEIRMIIEPVAVDYAYEVVRLKWLGADDGKVLQIMV
jgi:ribosome maturation factor RimP